MASTAADSHLEAAPSQRLWRRNRGKQSGCRHSGGKQGSDGMQENGCKRKYEEETAPYGLDTLLRLFVENSVRILGDCLTGIYLHGSAAMGCFNPEKSDVDLIVLVNAGMPDGIKKEYLDMVLALNRHAPRKGIEMSVVREEYCDPFVYPTPFELHFSVSHLDWLSRDPDDFVAKMKGSDQDLAAHFIIIKDRGKRLWGKGIGAVFGEVGKAEYFDSIRNDVAGARGEILTNTVYIVLNLCRVLAYKRDGRILSKAEGGKWGLDNLPEKYHGLILDALKEYSGSATFEVDRSLALDFADDMLMRIQ